MTDLKDLLRSVGAEAENVSVDGTALIPTIRRRRRVRTAAVGVGGAAAVTTLAVTAYAVLPGTGASDSSVSGSGTPTRLVDCETRLFVVLNPPRTKMQLTQKSMQRIGADRWKGTVKLTVTNISKATLDTEDVPETLLLSAPGNHRNAAVGHPTTQQNITLKPGASHTVEAQITVQGCSTWAKPGGTFPVYGPILGSKPIGRLQLP